MSAASMVSLPIIGDTSTRVEFGGSTTTAVSELREARDLIVQLQRELERARNVIEQQRDVVHRATRILQQRRGS